MRVSELYIHPIKSTAAISVNCISYTALGPDFDRHWMVVDANGEFLSQRKHATMCLIETRLEGQQLTLNAPEMEPLVVNEPGTHSVEVSVWGDQVVAKDCGDDAAQWLSHFLKRECRLVRLTEQTNRKVDTDFANDNELVSFADGFPSLIVSAESLHEFNQHLDTPIDMRRFRPNIVVAGCNPYAEDDWQSLRIGEMIFELVKPCSRCIMPSINQNTADKEMKVNQVLLKTRRGLDGKTYFGQNALHQGIGQICVGDPVEVIHTN